MSNEKWDSFLMRLGSKSPQSKKTDQKSKELDQMLHIRMPSALNQDRRSQSEKREEFEKNLKDLDKNAIEKLRARLELSFVHSQWDRNIIHDVDLALEKLLKFYNDFEDLNSQENRKVALKEKELKLEVKYDWSEKLDPVNNSV
ncbi:hypothetical protein [Vibrio metschnikovii]|uniref:hypothetical protein n=1 Tax=Vibrio metschnikovii TaxID=28172 RepID=UPI001C2FB30E|nr:hypothetical protein [Vibrio metschnikovii]